MTNAELREALKHILSLPDEEHRKLTPVGHALGGKFIDYTPDGRLTVVYTIKHEQRNGFGLLQGGCMAAFFDENFGLFSYIATKGNQFPTVDNTINYHKAVLNDTEQIFITTHIVSAGKRILSMAGEARNDKGELVATCQTNMLNVNGCRIYM